MLERKDRGMLEFSRDSRTRPPFHFLLVAVLLSLFAVAPAWSADWEQVIQCTGPGGNLNLGDLTAVSVGSGLADPAHPDWGGLDGYREAAQVPMTQTGTPTANREHAGVVVVKQRSKSSPLFMKALVNKEQLQCKIEFWDKSGTAVKLYTIALTNARIESIEMYSTGDVTSGLETIVFRAQQIAWTHNPTAVSFTDDLTASP